MADPLLYREVTGLWTARVPDGPDTDAYPDTVPLVGRVVFTPNYRKPLVYHGEHVIVEPINAVLVDGVLMTESIDGENITLGPLFLPVTVDERADQTWAWEMSFHDLRLGEYGETVELRPVRFQVPEGAGPLDLSTVAPVSSSGGVITVRGERGPGITDITAESGVVTVEWEGGEDVTIPIPTAALATPTSDGLMPAGDKAKLDAYPAKPMGVRYDTTAGTAVYVSDGTTEHLISYDSGWRDVQWLPRAVSSNRQRVSRRGDQVRLFFDVEMLAEGETSVPAIVPSGWRPQGFVTWRLGRYNSNIFAAQLAINSSGTTYILQRSASTARVHAEVQWTTRDALPTTLPGTPA